MRRGKRPPPERTAIVSSILALNGGADKKPFGASSRLAGLRGKPCPHNSSKSHLMTRIVCHLCAFIRALVPLRKHNILCSKTQHEHAVGAISLIPRRDKGRRRNVRPLVNPSVFSPLESTCKLCPANQLMSAAHVNWI